MSPRAARPCRPRKRSIIFFECAPGGGAEIIHAPAMPPPASPCAKTRAPDAVRPVAERPSPDMLLSLPDRRQDVQRESGGAHKIFVLPFDANGRRWRAAIASQHAARPLFAADTSYDTSARERCLRAARFRRAYAEVLLKNPPRQRPICLSSDTALSAQALL